MNIITSKEAIQKTNNAVAAYVEQTIEIVIPIINEAIEKACADARYWTDVDVSKYQHIEALGEKIIAKLKILGYECRLVDEYGSGRTIISISWAK